MKAGHLHHFKEQMRSAIRKTFRQVFTGVGERREKDTEEKKAKTERKEEVLCLSSQTAVGFRDIFQEESI